MNCYRLVFLLLCFCTLCCIFDANAEESSCDTSVERTTVDVKITSGTFKESGDDVTFQKSCSSELTTIKACSLETRPEDEVQTFCFPEDGKPAYSEYYQNIKFYVNK